VVEWLPLLLRIRGVSSSNLGPGDWLSCLRSFVIFLSPSRPVPGQYLQIKPRPLPKNPFQFIIFNLSSTLYNLFTKKCRKINYKPTLTQPFSPCYGIATHCDCTTLISIFVYGYFTSSLLPTWLLYSNESLLAWCLLVSYKNCAENTRLLIVEGPTIMSDSKEVNHNYGNVICCSMQPVLGNIYILKSTFIPVPGSFILTAWR
jgi:hypothetical protein